MRLLIQVIPLTPGCPVANIIQPDCLDVPEKGKVSFNYLLKNINGNLFRYLLYAEINSAGQM